MALGLSAVSPAQAAWVGTKLHVEGNQLFDGSRPIVLRGLNRAGPEGNDRSGPPINEYEIDQAHRWQANIVRVPLGQHLWNPDCPSQFAVDYPQKIDQIVKWITDRKMIALLALQWNTITPCGAPGTHKMADNPGSLIFWTSVAARYKDNPRVAFDLFNEPHDIADAVWKNGGLVNEDGVNFEAAGMQQMYDAIRATTAKNLVVISGSGWGAWPGPIYSNPVVGTDIAYAVHFYTCPFQPPPNCRYPGDPYQAPTGLFNLWANVKAQHPVINSEFGFPDANDGRYNASVISYAESHGWSWLAYAFNGTNNGGFGLIRNYHYRPTAAGRVVKDALQANKP